LPRSSTTQRVPSPTTRDVPLDTPRIAPRVLSDAPARDRRAGGSEPTTRFLSRLITGRPALIAALVLLALLPNLTVAAFVWLPAIGADPEEAKVKPVRDDATGTPDTRAKDANVTPDTRPKAAAKLSPALTVPSILEANAGGDIVLPIELDGTDGVPFRSAIAVNGLPAGATLSSGRPYGATGWNLKPDEIGDLHLVLPDAASGDRRLDIQLVDPAGEVIASAETTLKVAVKTEPAPEPPPPNSDPETALPEAQAEQTPQDSEANTGGEVRGEEVATAAVDEDPAPAAPSESADPILMNSRLFMSWSSASRVSLWLAMFTTRSGLTHFERACQRHCRCRRFTLGTTAYVVLGPAGSARITSRSESLKRRVASTRPADLCNLPRGQSWFACFRTSSHWRKGTKNGS